MSSNSKRPPTSIMLLSGKSRKNPQQVKILFFETCIGQGLGFIAGAVFHKFGDDFVMMGLKQILKF